MDARLEFGPDGADLVLEGGDLGRDDGLVTATVLSVLSDGLAPARTDVPLLQQDLRGYWAEAPGDPYGSLLWTLVRQKATQATASRAREIVEQALAWMVSSGIAVSIQVDAAYRSAGVLEIDVRLVRGTSKRWSSLWEATAAQAMRADGVLLRVQAG